MSNMAIRSAATANAVNRSASIIIKEDSLKTIRTGWKGFEDIVHRSLENMFQIFHFKMESSFHNDGSHGQANAKSPSETYEKYAPKMDSAQVAERVMSEVKSYFESYQKNHEGEDTSTQIEGYSKLIHDAVTEGYNASLKIMGEVSEEVSAKANESYQMILARLDEWKNEKHTEVKAEGEFTSEPAFV